MLEGRLPPILDGVFIRRFFSLAKYTWSSIIISMSGTNASSASFQQAMEQVRQQMPSVTMLAIEHALRDVSWHSKIQRKLLVIYPNILGHRVILHVQFSTIMFWISTVMYYIFVKSIPKSSQVEIFYTGWC